MPSIYTEVEFFYLQMKSLNGYGYLHNYHLTKTMVSDTSLSVFSTGFDHTQFFFFLNTSSSGRGFWGRAGGDENLTLTFTGLSRNLLSFDFDWGSAIWIWSQTDCVFTVLLF